MGAIKTSAHTHTLSLKLTEDAYRQLRRFAVTLEERTFERITHQKVLETALQEYLGRMANQSSDVGD